MIEIRLLGPVDVWADGRQLDAGPQQRRHVLAALAVDAGRPVDVPKLIYRVWGGSAGDGARISLQAHASRIRQMFANLTSPENPEPRAELELSHADAYTLRIDPGCVDLHRLRMLVDAQPDAEYPDAECARLLRQSLDRWCAEPLLGLKGDWPDDMRRGWTDLKVRATLAWARTERRLRRPEVAIGDLRDLVGERPLDERLVAELMRALAADHRIAEALDCYAALRQELGGQRGMEPGPELRALHAAISRGRPLEPGWPTPRQLPREVPGFAGRVEQLAQLDALLDDVPAANPDRQPAAVVISAVSGMPGVGKTALALRWAHRVQGRFPDGQLYVDLRGYDQGGRPTTPVAALRGLLDGLGVPPQRIPAGMDARAALYRSLLVGRRLLVVLDNARDAEQVRPLLPGSSTAVVLVTSRNDLAGLVGRDGAHLVAVDRMSVDEARNLLVGRLGRERVSAAPEAVDEIIARCARLPLALAIVAARAATRVRFPLETVAAQLQDAGGRLDALAGGDPTTDARAAFSWSYSALSPGAATMFRLLGLHPGPDVDATAAASMSGVPVRVVRSVLVELAAANLVTEHALARYTMHDLLRMYARELAHQYDPEQERGAAIHRVLDHYLHAAHTVSLALDPHRDPITLTAPESEVVGLSLTDQPHALSWFAAERQVLLGVVTLAETAGFDTHVWQLAWALTDFLDRQGAWHEWAAVWEAGRRAAQRLGDQAVEARAHRFLAAACDRLGDSADALVHYGHALDRYDRLGDTVGLARVHLDLGWLHQRQGRGAQALDHGREALGLYRSAGHPVGQANALGQLAWYHAQEGDHSMALSYGQQALDLQETTGDRAGAAATWSGLGYAHDRLGCHAEAVACYEQAHRLYRELENRYNQAAVLAQLGSTYQAAGDPDAASDAWEASLRLLDELDHPDVDHLRASLEQLGHPSSEASRSRTATDPIRDRLLVLAPPGTDERRLPPAGSQRRSLSLFGGYTTVRERFRG